MMPFGLKFLGCDRGLLESAEAKEGEFGMIFFLSLPSYFGAGKKGGRRFPPPPHYSSSNWTGTGSMALALDALTWLPAWKIREKIVSGEVSAMEVTKHFLGRIETLDPVLHALDRKSVV